MVRDILIRVMSTVPLESCFSADNYRLAILEAKPNTFLIPHHWDADVVVIIVKGKATINLVRNDNRESYNLECGDIARIPAGPMIYLVNRDDNENLQIVTLFRTISTPGHVSKFFSASSEDGESFYTAFSNEILEAALNTPKDKRMLGEKRKGVMREASKEQIKAMSEQASSSSKGGRWWSIHKSFIIPLGHVFTVVASEKENLQIIVFRINTQDNKRNFTARKEHNAWPSASLQIQPTFAFRTISPSSSRFSSGESKVSLESESAIKRRILDAGLGRLAASMVFSVPLDANATRIEYYYTVSEPCCELSFAPSGLGFCGVAVGTGPVAPLGELLNIHYTARFADGTVFDSNYKSAR
ncbi:PREDICTED: provicilin [Nelumbo nucifera]|uniref:Provicilin n=1 Tax=Nelumbo nucifera TaxID=4432 RepID=A0A1U8A887_NELNU|nr:PREDICTED: provicilin [Nelumbo nucifera]